MSQRSRSPERVSSPSTDAPNRLPAAAAAAGGAAAAAPPPPLPPPENGFTRKDLIDYVYENYPHFISKQNCEEIIDLVFEGIVNGVVQGGKVRITGFGSFSSKTRKARKARNPSTKESVQVPEKQVPDFRKGRPPDIMISSVRNQPTST